MSRLYREMRPSSWANLTEHFRALRWSWIFRGQREATWEISSTIERHGGKTDRFLLELGTRKLFSRKLHLYTGAEAASDTLLGLLALMQHYGVPTRLVDWTRSPYVAAFFALEEKESMGGERAVWAVNANWLNEMSRRLLCAKLSLSDNELPDRTDFSADDALQHYIFDLCEPLVVSISPSRANLRLAVQQGVFLCQGDRDMSFMENLAALGEEHLPDNLFKIFIPDSMRADALYELRAMNIGPESLFPGLDGFAREIRLAYSLLDDDPDSEETLELRRRLGVDSI